MNGNGDRACTHENATNRNVRTPRRALHSSFSYGVPSVSMQTVGGYLGRIQTRTDGLPLTPPTVILYLLQPVQICFVCMGLALNRPVYSQLLLVPESSEGTGRRPTPLLSTLLGALFRFWAFFLEGASLLQGDLGFLLPQQNSDKHYSFSNRVREIRHERSRLRLKGAADGL